MSGAEAGDTDGRQNGSIFTGLKRLLTPFRANEQEMRPASECVAKISALINESRRIRELLDAENERLAERGARLKALDAERIDALAEARLSGSASQQERTDNLLRECAALRQEIEDAAAVAKRMRDRIEALDSDRKALTYQYRCDLGAFLSQIQKQLMDRYNALAPEVAETILRVAALRRVMLRYKAGNSNGWDGRALLPGMVPGQGGAVPALLDAGSTDFDQEAARRMDEILTEMSAHGFIWRVD